MGRSHSKQRYRDGIEIKILRDVSNESVREDDFFFEFSKIPTILTILKTIRSRHVVLRDLIYTTEKRDSKIVRLMTRNNAWFERYIEENSLGVKFQVQGAKKKKLYIHGMMVVVSSSLFKNYKKKLYY